MGIKIVEIDSEAQASRIVLEVEARLEEILIKAIADINLRWDSLPDGLDYQTYPSKKHEGL
jgi:hypothetical protein